MELLSRIATRTLGACVQAVLAEPEVVPGRMVCVQTMGLVAHVYPHPRGRMIDGGRRCDETFVGLPGPEAAVLEESWRRTVLADIVRRGGSASATIHTKLRGACARIAQTPLLRDLGQEVQRHEINAGELDLAAERVQILAQG